MGATSEELKLLLTGDASGAKAAVQELAGALSGQLTTALQGTNAAAGVSQEKTSALSALFKEWKPATDDLHSAFTSFRSTLGGMWENPTDAVKRLGSALVADLGPALGAAGVGAGVVAAGIAVVTKEMIALAEHAREVGVEIGRMSALYNMSVEATSQLRFATQAAGGSFDDVARAMFMFEQRMENSSAKVDEGLHLIGLSLAEINAMPTDQRLFAISAGFRAAGEDTNKAAAAMDIFGRQGREMLPLLMKDLAGLAEKSAELGGTWTEEDVKAARAFTAEMNELKAATDAHLVAAGRHVAWSEDLSLIWAKLKLHGSELAEVLSDVAEKSLVLEQREGSLPKVLGQVNDALGEQKQKLQELKDKQEGINTTRENFNRIWHPQEDKQSWDDLKEAEREETEEAKASIEQNLKRAQTIDRIRESLLGNTKDVQENIAAVRDVLEAGEGENASMGRAIDLLQKLHDAGVELPADLEDWRAAYEHVAGAQDTVALSLSQLIERVPDLDDRLATMRDLLEQAREGMDDLASSTNEFHNGMTIAGTEISTVTIPAFSMLPNVVSRTTEALDQARGATGLFHSTLQRIGDALSPSGLLHNLVGAGMQSIFGPSGLVTTLMEKGIAKLADLAFEGLKKIGGFFKSLFGGPSADELAGREVVSKFEDNLHTMLTESEKLEAGNESWKQTVIALRDQYLALGRSQEEAMQDAERLWASSKQGAAESAQVIDEIKAKLAGTFNGPALLSGPVNADTGHIQDFPSVGGAVTAEIPSFDHRTMERVVGSGLALLHPGDVVGVPQPGQLGGQTIHLQFNDTVFFRDRGAMQDFTRMVADTLADQLRQQARFGVRA